MSAEQEARDEAVLRWPVMVDGVPDDGDAAVARGAFELGATWQDARDAETIAGLQAEVERLRESTSFGMYVTVKAEREEQRASANAAEAKVRAVAAVCAQLEVMPIPVDPCMSQTAVTGRIVATIIRAIRAVIATTEPTVQAWPQEDS